jgi:hypothetical protein
MTCGLASSGRSGRGQLEANTRLEFRDWAIDQASDPPARIKAPIAHRNGQLLDGARLARLFNT